MLLSLTSRYVMNDHVQKAITDALSSIKGCELLHISTLTLTARFTGVDLQTVVSHKILNKLSQVAVATDTTPRDPNKPYFSPAHPFSILNTLILTFDVLSLDARNTRYIKQIARSHRGFHYECSDNAITIYTHHIELESVIELHTELQEFVELSDTFTIQRVNEEYIFIT